MTPPHKEIKRYRRFQGWDYSRGAVLFITFGLKKRLSVFGRAEGDKVVYNKVGEAAVVERCLRAVKKGFVPISTFISPAELALKRALIEAKLPMIRVVPDALATVYRPKEDEPWQFAEGRLLLLSRVCKAGVSRYDAWHGVNDALASVALKAQPDQDGEEGLGGAAAVKGVAVYVVLNRATGQVEWRF